jgi:thiazole synthase
MHTHNSQPQPANKPLVLAGKTYDSRLIIGSGKYRDFQQNLDALEASGAQMITVAIRMYRTTLKWAIIKFLISRPKGN